MSHEHPNWRMVDQVEDVLDAYAEARLSPRKPVLARMRAAVVAEAAMAAARAAHERQAAVALAAVETTARRGRFAFPRLTLASFSRPAFALGVAGLLALGTGTVVSAAAPGSPLYSARVGLETLFLPVEIDARFASHQQHLDERLAEAEAAAAAGDPVALQAALAAYQDEIDQTLADIGNDYSRLERFQAVLELHVAKLTALSLSLPTDVARDLAEEHAVEASERAVTKVADAVSRVKDKKAGADNRPPAPPAANPPSRATSVPVQPDRRPAP
jgi:hypothetical protein